MTIVAGTRLGPYEIVAPLGAGGMGEVWRGRDTRLDRSVAIKILPAALAGDAQFKIRFEREARAISQLNHPHICTLYDVGDSYLVMELLEGESLADRVTKGPMPLEQVLRYGTQIADALDKAHREGIVHRDLKPGNVMITKSGAKLLDFGLAKSAVAPSGVFEATEHKPLTAEGTVIGTVQYMAPEQLEGLEADPRTDIFSLGALLYEMATGQRAFNGKTKSSLIASIVSAQPPPISAIQPLTPPAFEHVVAKCLAKDRDDRWQSAHDIAEELRWIGGVGMEAGVVARTRTALRSWIVAGLLAIALIAVASMYVRSRVPPRLIETEISAPPSRSSFNAQISPDGTRIVFPIADNTGKRKFIMRSLSSTGFKVIEGTEDGFGPFWSRDSRTLFFFANSYLCRTPANGGPVEKVATIPAVARGGSVNQDGVILLSVGGDIQRIGPAGTLSVVSRHRPEETWRNWPAFLPDGNHFVYWARTLGDRGTTTLRVSSLDGKIDKVLAPAESRAFYVPPGYLIFTSANHVVAQKFDLRKLELEDEPVVLADSVDINPIPGAVFSPSDNGMLLYRAASSVAGTSQLTWFDRFGHEIDALAPPSGFWDTAVSHDGRHVAVRIGNLGGVGHLWLYDVDRKVSTRLTAGDMDEAAPIWSADDQSIFYTSATLNEWKVYRRPVASDQPTLLSRSPEREFVSSVSPDGRFVLVHSQARSVGPSTHYVTHLLSLADGKRLPFGDERFSTESGKFSPDGKWVAYSSDESDRAEIYVQRFPDRGLKTRISTDGGTIPIWSHDGKRLYYHQLDDKIVAVDLRLGTTVEPGKPQPLLTVRTKNGPNQQFDVAPDGKILANVVVGDENVAYTLVQNWTAKLK